MLNYNIETDLIDQRASYLKNLLGAVAIISLGLFGLALTKQIDNILLWLWLVGTLIVSEGLRRKKYIRPAIWVFLLGLTVLFAFLLWNLGASTNIYLLMLVPVVFAIILARGEGMIGLAVLICALIYGLTAAKTNIAVAADLSFMPCLLCAVLVFMTYINASDALDLMHWATDIQQKDAHRAEMFYEQKENLAEMFLQLTHTKSKLELTNRKLEEAQIRAEQASQAKSVFLSNMSHELRTPLNVVIAYSTTMLDMPQLYKNIQLPSEYRSDLQLIKDNGHYLLGLINDILDLSKIEAGKLEIHCATAKLPKILSGVISTSIGLVKDKPIQIRPDFPDNLPPAWADATRVRQILLNLMSNAIKFTQTGSVTLHAHAEDNAIRISVIDTGKGIPEKALPHIFDRFEQAERDTDKYYGGTGLGLDISRRLARMHGGDLTVESTVGHGSTFSFILPISHEEALEQPELPLELGTSIEALRPKHEVTTQTILLIEDETSLRDMMRRVLEGFGHMVVDAQDGAEALNIASGLIPELIILDISLPTMNGWDLLKNLKNNPDTARIPVLVCTANDDEGRSFDLGATSYLRKPFAPDQFMAYVEDILPQSTPSDEVNLQ